MFGKIITSENREYYSEIFAIFNDGWNCMVITYDSEASKFEFINFYEKTPSLKRKVFIFDYSDEDFVKIDTIKLGNNEILEKAEGYSWMLNDIKLLNAIINGEEVEDSYKELGKKHNEKHEVQEWRYVKNQKDINDLLSCSFGFHDSYLTSIKFVNRVFKPERPSLEVVFEGCWGLTITLIIIGELDFHFNFDDSTSTADIYEANIFFENDKIYWTDCSAKSFDEIDEECVYFSGKVMKWKMNN